MLMTRDNPSIATNVNTITSSVTILSNKNCADKALLSPFGEKKWILGQLNYSACVPVLVLIRSLFELF